MKRALLLGLLFLVAPSTQARTLADSTPQLQVVGASATVDGKATTGDLLRLTEKSGTVTFGEGARRVVLTYRLVEGGVELRKKRSKTPIHMKIDDGEWGTDEVVRIGATFTRLEFYFPMSPDEQQLGVRIRTKAAALDGPLNAGPCIPDPTPPPPAP